MRIVNLKKFIRSICIILLVIFILSLIFAKSSLSHKEVEYTKFYVEKGDTLWTIATYLKNHNDYYRDKDVRDIILDIKDINGLESSNIYVNQELLIPSI